MSQITSAVMPTPFEKVLRFALKLRGGEKEIEQIKESTFLPGNSDPELKFTLCLHQGILKLLPVLIFRLFLSSLPVPRCPHYAIVSWL